MKRALGIVLAVLVFAGWAAAIAAPFPKAVGAAQTYECVWGSGTTSESYASAYASLAGAGGQGVVLERGGAYGVIAPSAAYRKVYAVLEGDDFAQLMSVSAHGLTRIERAAVWKTYSARLWYADEFFTWTGNGVGRTELSRRFDGSVLTAFSGLPSPETLAWLQTVRLELRGGAFVSAEDLVGTAVESIGVRAPYAFSDGVVTLDTAGGRRIVCGVPAAGTLVLPDADYADEGALLPCDRLTELTVPFAGSAKKDTGSDFHGELAYLFSTGTQYRVPESLKKVTVTGGTLRAFAFYACPELEEITACGVAEEDISAQAFLGCGSLRALHSPRRDVRLTGTFSARELPCGCTLFERD